MRDLIKKINSLSTGNTKSKEANLRETFHYGNKSIFLVIENIKEAMNTNRKLDVTIAIMTRTASFSLRATHRAV